MIPLILFVCLGVVVLVVFEVRARREQKTSAASSAQDEKVEVSTEQRDSDDGCCGEHLVCERETLLQTNAEIIYYDDEELDALFIAKERRISLRIAVLSRASFFSEMTSNSVLSGRGGRKPYIVLR